VTAPSRRFDGPRICMASAALLGATVLAACGGSTGAPTGHVTLSVPSPLSTPTAVVYKDPQGRWSATFEGTPKYTNTTESTAEGRVPYMVAEYASFDVDEFVGVLLAPVSSTYNFTKGVDGVASSIGGTVVSVVSGPFRGYSSAEGVISAAIGVMKCRIVRVGAVVYIMGTVGPVNPPADYASFIASVTLTPH
jgi:hypothetical protein